MEDVHIAFPRGKISVLVGGSGTGKSVLLRILAGLIAAAREPIGWTGQIGWDHRPFDHSSNNRAGVVFQQFALFDELSPTSNVQFALDHRPVRLHPAEHSADSWLQLLGVPADRSVAVLSGGQKQRLAIARTLAADPEIILYDEPTSGLDAGTGGRVADLIRQTQLRFGRTSIVVTHDYQTLLPIADEVFLLDAATRSVRRLPPEQWSQIAGQMERASSPAAASELAEVRPGDEPRRDQASPPVHADVPSRSHSEVPSPSYSEEQTRQDNAGVESSPNTAGKKPAGQPSSRLARRVLRNGWNRACGASGRFLQRTGDTIVAAARLPYDARPVVPRTRWAIRFGFHYLRLIGGPSACIYLLIAGFIVGFTTTYFTFRFLPFRLYTQPLLVDDLLASIGFALYRVLVPILATILVAARCGAAVAADVGVKQYGGQTDAMRTLGIRPPAYLLVPILVAFLIATPLLQWLAFESSRWVSGLTFAVTHPEMGQLFWQQHFDRLNVPQTSAWKLNGWDLSVLDAIWTPSRGWGWVTLKSLLCGFGTAAISYHQGMGPKESARDVSRAITATVLWSTLFVLVVHFCVALMEF